MPHRSSSNDDLLDRALDLFRTYGVAGASLSRLSEATGLEKASLYSRHPGGNDEIVVAMALQAWMKAFTDIARDSGLSPTVARLRAKEAIVRPD